MKCFLFTLLLMSGSCLANRKDIQRINLKGLYAKDSEIEKIMLACDGHLKKLRVLSKSVEKAKKLLKRVERSLVFLQSKKKTPFYSQTLDLKVGLGHEIEILKLTYKNMQEFIIREGCPVDS